MPVWAVEDARACRHGRGRADDGIGGGTGGVGNLVEELGRSSCAVRAGEGVATGVGGGDGGLSGRSAEESRSALAAGAAGGRVSSGTDVGWGGHVDHLSERMATLTVWLKVVVEMVRLICSKVFTEGERVGDG